ncbi:MAG TPA: hypothetical protein VM120_23995 [Bryobacteraceae bacterium]|nr:hypothetical protein [Bryobacteraceae bacterium]
MLRHWAFCGLLLGAGVLNARVITTGTIMERDGLARRGSLLEQGIPIPPMSPQEAATLVLRRADGLPLRAHIEPESKDPEGNVTWVRVSALVSMPASGRIPVRLETADGDQAAPLNVQRSVGRISVETPAYKLTLSDPGGIELSAGGKPLLAGNWSVDLIADTRGILWGTYLREFTPDGVTVEEQGPWHATLLLRGYMGKNFRKDSKRQEPGRRFDCELRLFVSALTPEIRYSWRLTNLSGTKTWLERYALQLPLAVKGTAAGASSSRMLIAMPQTLAVTANFIRDLGKGAGMRLSGEGRKLLIGGLDMPPDGGFYAGAVPDVHRLFYDGMSRSFGGALIPSGSMQAAAEAMAPLDIVLPAQYYSDVKALPEQGDPVTFGEFAPAIQKSAEWLLAHQWRGTLFWGEWYREWDLSRNMGTQEASNGHSPLAPLYHYWRTGDARFLRCAERSAQYVWDVQISKSERDQGRMFHTRRHLFDELDWIHPRYQRATGTLISSHAMLNPVMRREVIQTVRSFHEHMFDDQGIPHDWDKAGRKRSTRLAGVDTSNFMEALSYCYLETGDRQFLDWALSMSKWTAARFLERGRMKGDDWNWNLTNYALRGLVALYETSGDETVKDLAIRMSHATLENMSPNTADIQKGMGGGDRHFVFYHAWISTRVAKVAPDGPEMTRKLLQAVRREVAAQTADGLFPLDHGMEAGKETRWGSYYAPKSFVAFVPVLTAHLAAQQTPSARRK